MDHAPTRVLPRLFHNALPVFWLLTLFYFGSVRYGDYLHAIQEKFLFRADYAARWFAERYDVKSQRWSCSRFELTTLVAVGAPYLTYAAFSSNKTFQDFHTLASQKIDVFALASDPVLLNPRENAVRAKTATPNEFVPFLPGRRTVKRYITVARKQPRDCLSLTVKNALWKPPNALWSFGITSISAISTKQWETSPKRRLSSSPRRIRR